MLNHSNHTLLSSPSVDISFNPKYGKRCLHFSFKGKFSKEASFLCSKAWSEEFDKNPDKQYVHIWDCEQMTDFDFDAKDVWLEMLFKYKYQIESVWLASNSLFIRGAARVMSKFSSLNLKIYRSIEEIESKSKVSETI